MARGAWAGLCALAAMMARTARLAVGVPDYARYVQHLRVHHPERPVPSRDAFFRERMAARYGRGRSRCC